MKQITMSQIIGEYVVWIQCIAAENSKDYVCGTGYAIGPHWVITCYHNVEDLDDNGKFIVWWENQKGDGIKQNYPPLTKNNIEWWNKEHDIALIRCFSPYNKFPDLSVILPDEIKAQTLCECSGYLAKYTSENCVFPRKEGIGITIGGGNTKSISSGGCSSIAFESWDGFSGSPIYYSGKLIGLVKGYVEGTNNQGLHLTFIGPALDAPCDGNKNCKVSES